MLLSKIKSLVTNVPKVLPIGHPLLNSPCKPVPVEALQTAEFKEVTKKMETVLSKNMAFGVSSVQLGFPHQCFAIDFDQINKFDYLYDKKTKRTGSEELPRGKKFFVNPKITYASAKKLIDLEGCLSLDGYVAKVRRAETITINYLTTSGESKTESYGFTAARTILHEMDHLHGVNFVDKMEPKTMIPIANALKGF